MSPTLWGQSYWLLLWGRTAAVCCGRHPTSPAPDGVSTQLSLRTGNCIWGKHATQTTSAFIYSDVVERKQVPSLRLFYNSENQVNARCLVLSSVFKPFGASWWNMTYRLEMLPPLVFIDSLQALKTSQASSAEHTHTSDKPSTTLKNKTEIDMWFMCQPHRH